MNPVAALLFSITVVNLFLGALVFFRNRNNPLYLSLSAFIFLIAAWTASMGAFYYSAIISDAFWWIRLTYVFGIILANTLVYFALIFPRGARVPLRRILLVYAPAIPMVAALLFIPDFLFKEIVIYEWWKDVRLGTFDYIIYTIYFVIVYFGAILILLNKYFSYSGQLKLQLIYVTVAVCIAGFFGAIFDLLFPWINLYQYIWLGPIGTLIMVGIFTYAIVRHRFLDIRLVAARAAVYSILITLIGITYVSITFVSTTLFLDTAADPGQILIYTILTLLIALSFQRLRHEIEEISDRIFFKGRYDTNQLLLRLGSIMSTNIELRPLTTQIIQILIGQMRISRGAFVILGEGLNSIYDIIDVGFHQKFVISYEQLSPFLVDDKIMLFDELEENNIKALMREADVSVVKTLKVEDKVVGLLFLGEKASGEIYSEQDLRLLEILVPEVAIAIQNAQSFDKIKKFNVILSEEVKKATVDLQSANERLKTVDKLKDDFVSIASHELRTPMTAIRSYAWMALHRSDVPLSEKLQKYLIRVLLSTERLINLVNDMLNLSRIESGKIEINPEPVDLHLLIKDIIDELYFSKSQEKEIQFVVLEKRIPKAFADPEKLRQVFLNLVGNSLKFTPHGGKIVFDFFTDGRMVEVSVSDTGVGISKEDMSKLFYKFSRLDNSYTAAATSGGTGLGLYISKNLVELMHGRIWVSSAGLGKGTTFTVALPPATPDKIEHASEYAVKPRGGEAKPLEPVMI